MAHRNPQQNTPALGLIYVIESEDLPLVKIGYSRRGVPLRISATF